MLLSQHRQQPLRLSVSTSTFQPCAQREPLAVIYGIISCRASQFIIKRLPKPQRTARLRKSRHYLFFRARQTLSGVVGFSSTFTPSASRIAFPTAGATPSIGISATAFTPNG